MSGAISVTGLQKRYGTLTVLDGVDFNIAEGEFVSIVGPSGCGKSTVLEILGGLKPADGGHAQIDGTDVNGPRASTGIIFQEASTLPWRTLLANVALPMELRGVPKGERLERARRAIDLVGLHGFHDHYPNQLSGGMRQRVALARVMATDPDVILADEPFGQLDEQTRLVVGLELLSAVHESDAGVLFITHSIQEAVLLSDRVLVMSARPGVILTDVRTDLGDTRTADLIGSPAVDQLAEAVWSVLRDESMKAMQQQGVA